MLAAVTFSETATLPPVVNHFDRLFGLNLTAAQKVDLVEYLKSL